MSTHQHLKVVLAGREPDLSHTPPPCVGVLAFPRLHIVDVYVALGVPSDNQVGLPGYAGDRAHVGLGRNFCPISD